MGIIKQESSKGSGEGLCLSENEYVLRLYVTGATPNSLRAITNIKSICERHLAGRYSLEIIDVYKDQERVAQEQIIALPMLIKLHPFPHRKLIGDLSHTKKVLEVLSIKN
jgi:circadian clock protein KaiB